MLLRSKNKVQRFVTANNDLTDVCLGSNSVTLSEQLMIAALLTKVPRDSLL